MEEIEEGNEEGEAAEPSLTASNPNERKLARRLRIERRNEALRKQKEKEAAAESAQAIEPEVVKSPIDTQIERSTTAIYKLTQDGEEYVTNVQIANEAREADRREREGISKEKLFAELDEEAAAAEQQFNEIAARWGGILQYHDPLHISEDINAQKERCSELLRQKDEIIAKLRGMIKSAEINFAIDQRKQVQDIYSLAKRIERQIIAMRKAYRTELQMIEDVILAERQLLIDATNKKWEELAKKRDQEEQSNADKKTEDYWNFVKDMEDLDREFEELYRETTISLENDCDALTRELERIKTEAVMNSEKLDYNYQILRKREDENMIIRSQQKRRINKLQDVINSLRKKIREYSADTELQINKLSEEIVRLTLNVLDIEKKADHLAKVNNNKFHQVWDMNQERAEKLLRKILDIDRILHEQQLGIEWDPPDLKPILKTELPSYREGLRVEHLDKEKPYLHRAPNFKKPPNLTDDSIEGSQIIQDEHNPAYKRVVRSILRLISEKSGFLVEDQLKEILEPYMEHEKTLIKVDNIFSALHITQRDDIDILVSRFIPYMFCPVCNLTSEKTAAQEESLVEVTYLTSSLSDIENSVASSGSQKDENILSILATVTSLEPDDTYGSTVKVGPCAVTLFDDGFEGECKGPSAGLEDKNQNTEAATSDDSLLDGARVPCQFQHPLLISTVYVLKALREFLTDYHIAKESMPTMSARLVLKRNTVSRLMTKMDIEMYWTRYREIFGKDAVHLWDSLMEGLKKYHEMLKERKEVSEAVVHLRHENMGVRHLFAKYVRKDFLPY